MGIEDAGSVVRGHGHAAEVEHGLFRRVRPVINALIVARAAFVQKDTGREVVVLT